MMKKHLHTPEALQAYEKLCNLARKNITDQAVGVICWRRPDVRLQYYYGKYAYLPFKERVLLEWADGMKELQKMLLVSKKSWVLATGDKLLEAINREYSREVLALIKDFKELRMRNFFSDHMEAKMLQHKCFNRAECSRTVILPKECHFTSPKPLIDRCRALFHRSRALEKVLELKGRWEGRIGGLSAAFIFAVIPVAYIGGYCRAEALNVRK